MSGEAKFDAAAALSDLGLWGIKADYQTAEKIAAHLRAAVERVAALEAGLRPFAEFGELTKLRRSSDESHLAVPGFTSKDLPTFGDCRRAAALLGGAGG